MTVTTRQPSQPSEFAEAKAVNNVFQRERRDRSEQLGTLGLQSLIVLTLLGSWQALAILTTWNVWISSPTNIWDQLRIWAESGLLWEGTSFTLQATLLGFAIGAVGGLVAGALMGSMRRFGGLIEPLILAIYSIPKIALAPLFVLWFGIDLLPKIMLAALLVFFPVFFSVYQGFLTIDQELLGVTRLMGANRIALMRKVAMPYSAAWMFSGLKIGLPYALIGAVVGEFIASTKGLGYMISSASSVFNTAGVFAGLVVLMVISTVLSFGLSSVEHRVLHWSGKGV